jgi:hypothetical protein
MNGNCCICLEKCLIPVEVKCFSCYTPNQISCSSFCRVCIACVFRFLQLDIDSDQRDFTKKCLFCPGTVSPYTLSPDNAFRLDYTLMLMDSKVDHVCSFCLNYSGSQIMIHQHLERECPKYSKQCECKKVFQKQDFYFHLFSCSSHFHCKLCTKYIEKSQFTNHMKFIHNYISCPYCQQYVFSEIFLDHTENNCLERPVTCGFCFEVMKHQYYKTHLVEHLNDVVQELKQIKHTYQECLEKYKCIHELLGPFRNLLEG